LKARRDGRIERDSKEHPMKGPLAGLMQQAQRMQEDMKRAQEEIAQVEVTGQAGGGIVSVVMSGRHEVRRVSIDRAAIGDDHEMMEDLVAAAFNDAVNKVAALSQEQMSQVTGGMSLPPGFKLPF
jgi:DNA-binding YbaB/EbfC family protein